MSCKTVTECLEIRRLLAELQHKFPEQFENAKQWDLPNGQVKCPLNVLYKHGEEHLDEFLDYCFTNRYKDSKTAILELNKLQGIKLHSLLPHAGRWHRLVK